MEIAKFVLAAIGTFISVSGLSFAVFQFWCKKKEERDESFKNSIRKELETERRMNSDKYEASHAEAQGERSSRKDEIKRLEARIEKLEKTVTDDLIRRIGNIEGEMRGMREILKTIQTWFVSNTPTGGR